MLVSHSLVSHWYMQESNCFVHLPFMWMYICTCVIPEHLVQFVGCHAAAIIGKSYTGVTGFFNYIYPDLFSGYTRI